MNEYKNERIPIAFDNPFERELFQKVCVSRLSHIKFYLANNALSYIEGLKDSYDVEEDISIAKTKMKKSITLIPTLVVPKRLPSTMQILEKAPQSKLVSFKLRCYRINKTLRIRMRSIGSLHSNIGPAIFLVSSLDKNTYLRSLLTLNGFPEKYFT